MCEEKRVLSISRQWLSRIVVVVASPRPRSGCMPVVPWLPCPTEFVMTHSRWRHCSSWSRGLCGRSTATGSGEGRETTGRGRNRRRARGRSGWCCLPIWRGTTRKEASAMVSWARSWSSKSSRSLPGGRTRSSRLLRLSACRRRGRTDVPSRKTW